MVLARFGRLGSLVAALSTTAMHVDGGHRTPPHPHSVAQAPPPLFPKLVLIPAGTTVVGTSTASPLGGGVALDGRPYGDFDERPHRTTVQVSAFRIGATEVTNAEYERYDPAHRLLRGFEHGYSIGDNEAVIFVSQENATRFCDWLSTQPDAAGVEYRLPTEVEWERAARASTATNFWFGDAFDGSKARLPGATCPANCPNLTVAQFGPNQLGVYDTVGNVEEWTSDAYRPYPGSAAGGFSSGLISTRGGSHSSDTGAYYLRAANRAAAVPHERASTIGFRVAASVTPVGGYGDTFSTRRRAPARALSATYRVDHITIKRALSGILSEQRGTSADTPIFRGPFEYIRFSQGITETSGGPLFLQHNHAPGLGVLPGGTTLLVGWFSTISESGREPVYASAALDVSGIASPGWPRANWSNASLLWKAADRGQQTQLFHTDQTTRVLSWYACMSPQAGYVDAAVVRRDLLPLGVWSNATIVTHTTDRPTRPTPGTPPPETVPAHGDGHIPFERIVPVTVNGTQAIAMTATYLETPPDCIGCPTSAASVVLLSTDGGHEWTHTGGAMSGISQFVVLRNSSWLALGRGGGGFPARPTPTAPGMTQSISHDQGETWNHGWRSDLWPLGVGVRHVFFRLVEGPLLLVSFTWGSNITTVTGKVRRFTGLYAALSTDEGTTFPCMKPLVNEGARSIVLPTMDSVQWTMTNATAEPRGYTSARQTTDGMIHVVSSRLSYHFNLAWLQRAAPDAPNAPPLGPSPPGPPPLGPPIPNGTWYTPHGDWAMSSATAKRTIKAVRATTIRSTLADDNTIDVKTGWQFVLVDPPVINKHNGDMWVLQCPCPRH